MTHCTEDDLILHYYGEKPGHSDIDHHLAACSVCSASYRSIAETLQLVVAPEVPERDDSYALQVWSRVRSRLPERPAPWWQAWFAWRAMTVGAAVASVL